MSDIDLRAFPAPLRDGLLKLSEFCAAYPDLAAGIVSVKTDDIDGKVTARWSHGDVNYSEVQAVAFKRKELPWKHRLNPYRKNELDWLVTVGDVTLVLPCAEPLPLTYESAMIDWSKVKVSADCAGRPQPYLHCYPDR